MTVLEIKHHDNNTKTYWFYVPRGLNDDRFRLDDKVLCKTSRGYQPGRVYSILQTNSDRVSWVRSPVVGKYYRIPTNFIKISDKFAKTKPRPEKMAEKLDYFYKTGNFEEPIIVKQLSGSSWELVDGYTSYLIARMFNKDTVKVYAVEVDA